MISRRLLLGLVGAGVLAFVSAPAALAFSPEARTAKLDETLRGLVEGRSTPGIAVLILQNGRPVTAAAWACEKSAAPRRSAMATCSASLL